MPSHLVAFFSTMPLPRLAFSTLGCPELTISEVIELAVHHGFGGIELRCLSGTVLRPDNFAELLPDVAAVGDHLLTTQRRIVGIGTSVRLLEPKSGDIETLLAFGHLADALACPHLRVFDGGEAGRPISPDDLARGRDFFDAWREARSRAGIRAHLMVETHDALATAAGMRAVREALPDLRVLWDLHHTWRAGAAAAEFGAVVADALVHVHLKDSVSRPSARKPFTYVRPGAGEFDWPGALRLLEQLDFDGSQSFEWERQWHPELEPLGEVLGGYADLVGGTPGRVAPPSPTRSRS